MSLIHQSLSQVFAKTSFMYFFIISSSRVCLQGHHKPCHHLVCLSVQVGSIMLFIKPLRLVSQININGKGLASYKGFIKDQDAMSSASSGIHYLCKGIKVFIMSSKSSWDSSSYQGHVHGFHRMSRTIRGHHHHSRPP